MDGSSKFEKKKVSRDFIVPANFNQQGRQPVALVSELDGGHNELKMKFIGIN